MGTSWEGHGSRRRIRAALGWVILAGITAAGLYLRTRDLWSSWLYMDNTHPPLRAIAVVRGELLPWRGEAVGFHFGMLQTWILVPLAAIARDLPQIWFGSAVLHSLGTVPAGLAGRRLGGWSVGLLAALLFATWPILVQHPQVGAWTYHAPLFTALAAWAAAHALRGPSRVALLGLAASLAVAVHMHPFALAPALGAWVLTPRLTRLHGARAMVQALTLAALILAPMIVDNGQSVFGETGDESVRVILQDASVGHARLLRESVLAAGAGWPPWLSMLVLSGLLLVPVAVLLTPRRERPSDPGTAFALWTLVSYALVAIIAVVLHYMRPSHAAPLFPLHGVTLAWVVLAIPERLAKRARPATHADRLRASIAGGMALAIGVPWFAPASAPRGDELPHLATLDTVNTVVADHAGDAPFVLALVADNSAACNADPDVYQSDLWLRGATCARTRKEVLNTSPAPIAYVVAALRPETWAAWEGTPDSILRRPSGEGGRLQILPFDDIEAATTWLATGCPLRDTWPEIDIGDAERTLGGLRTVRARGDRVTGEYQAFCVARVSEAAPPVPATVQPIPPTGPAGEALLR